MVSTELSILNDGFSASELVAIHVGDRVTDLRCRVLGAGLQVLDLGLLGFAVGKVSEKVGNDAITSL